MYQSNYVSYEAFLDTRHFCLFSTIFFQFLQFICYIFIWSLISCTNNAYNLEMRAINWEWIQEHRVCSEKGYTLKKKTALQKDPNSQNGINIFGGTDFSLIIFSPLYKRHYANFPTIYTIYYSKQWQKLFHQLYNIL